MPRCVVSGCKCSNGIRPPDEQIANRWKEAIGYAGQVGEAVLFNFCIQFWWELLHLIIHPD